MNSPKPSGNIKRKKLLEALQADQNASLAKLREGLLPKRGVTVTDKLVNDLKEEDS